MMINECTKNDSSKILYVINDSAIKYKGIIPNHCWHEPYMSEQELINEFFDGVRMFGDDMVAAHNRCQWVLDR